MEVPSMGRGDLNHEPDSRKPFIPSFAGSNTAQVDSPIDEGDQDSASIICNSRDGESSRPLLPLSDHPRGTSAPNNNTFTRARGPDHDESENDDDNDAALKPPAKSTQPSLFQRATAFALLISLLLGFTSSVLSIPEVRLLETAICRDYYRIHDPSVIGPPPLSYVDESLCKLDSIQVDLAYLSTTRSQISSALGIMLTIPYGRLSSRIGRRPSLLLGLMGEIMAYFWLVLVCYFHQVFATKLVLLSPAFILVGGGSKVIAATVNMVITDVTAHRSPVSENGFQRESGNEAEAVHDLPSSSTSSSHGTTMFYLIGVTMLSSSLVGVSLGSYLLSVDLWLPHKVNSVILLAMFVVLAVGMPETIEGNRHEGMAGTKSVNRTMYNHGIDDNDNPDSPFVGARQGQRRTMIPDRLHIWSFVQGFMSKFRERKPLASGLRSFGAMIWGHHHQQQKEIRLTLFLIFLTVFTASSGRLLIQYASKALDWSLSTIGYIFGVRFLVSLLVLVVLAAVGIINAHPGTNTNHNSATKFLKSISWWTSKFQVLMTDIWIVRCSFTVLGLGTLFTALGNGPLFIMGIILSAFGGGLAPALQGLLAHFSTVASLQSQGGNSEGMEQDASDAESGGGNDTRGARDTTAEVFSSAALFELLAELVGGFVFAGLFDLGTKGFGGIGIGLPFHLCAIMTFLGAVLSFLLPEV